ncbi:MAG: hypothetical protein JO060_04450, partial [Candidatus Eremiobacteraeota bacterium]|nr:hypothetical protein [Candidatus Eremiobacteraeota bacterium]
MALALLAATATVPAIARERSAKLTVNDVVARAHTVNDPPLSTKTRVEEWELSAEGLAGTQT